MTHLLQISILNSILGPACSMLGAAFQALLCPIHSSSIFLLLPSLFSDLIAWYQRTTVVAFWPAGESNFTKILGASFSQTLEKKKTLPLDFGAFPLLGPWAWCPPWPRVTKWQILSVTGRIINTPPSCSDSPSQPRKALSPRGQKISFREQIQKYTNQKYITQLQWFTITTNREKHSSWSGPKKVVEKNLKFRRA